MAARLEQIEDLLQEVAGGEFARLLYDEGLISPEKLRKVVRIYRRLPEKKLLSRVLIELGVLSEDEHRRILRKHGRRFRIGELMCELGYISLDQLRQAEQAIVSFPGKRMGEILIHLGFVTEQQLAQALSEQLDLPLVHLEFDMLDLALVRRFSLRFLRRNMVLPMTEGEGTVAIAVADPLQDAPVQEIAKQLGKRAEVFIALASAMEGVFNRLEKGVVGKGRDHVAEVVDGLLATAIREGASDVHLEPMPDHLRIRYRLDGVLVTKTHLPIELGQRVINRLKTLAGMDIADARRHQDGRISRSVNGAEVDLRVSTYVTIFGENLVLRILRRQGGLRTLEQIHMNEALLERFKHEALDIPTGVIIITGPTGSGKTTTLYAAIDYLNSPTVKIITLEDPVEFVIEGIMQCSVDVKAGRTFETSLKAIVRQDPDIIVLGEVRDRMSAEVAVQAALTGHKVLTTFHTEDSIGGLLRLIDMGIETFLISSTVISIVAQRLIRCICPDCRQPYVPDARIAQVVGLDQETLRNHTFYRGVGCSTCHGTGYHGRIGLHELLILNEDVRNAILERKTSHEVRRISAERTQLLSLMEDGLYKVMKGHTTVEEVYRVAPRSAIMRPVKEVMRMMGEEV